MQFTQIADAGHEHVNGLSPIVIGNTQLLMFGLVSEQMWALGVPIAGGAWSEVGNIGIPPRSEFSVVAIGGGFFFLGGRSLAGVDTSIYTAPADGITWSPAGTAPFGPRFSLCAVNFQGNLFVYAGSSQAGAQCNDVWVNGDGGITWKLLTPHAAFPPTDKAGCASFRGSMFLVGGMSGNLATNQVWASQSGVTWTNLGPAPWPARYLPAVAVAGQALYVMGGYGASGELLNDIWKTTTGKSWTQVPGVLPGANVLPPSATSDGTTIYIGSGHEGIWSARP
jgi:hypothetical protein